MSEHLSPEALELWAMGSADSAEERRHLDICLECAQDLKEAKEYFAALGGLPSRKAPPGFALRLRARLDAPSGWRKLGAALFFPWYFKVPMQLVGAALVALLIWALPARLGKSVPLQLAQAENPAPSPAPPPADHGEMAEKKIAPERSENRRGKLEESDELISPEPPRPPVPENLAMARGRASGARAFSPKLENPQSLQPMDEPVAAIESPSGAAKSAASESKAEPPASAPLPSIMLSLKQDSLIRALGFRLDIREGVVYYELKTSKVAGDSLATRLQNLGLGDRTIVYSSSESPDSVVIKVH